MDLRSPSTLPRLGWVWLGAFLSCLIAWWARPLLPIDETRYVSVAWEMWRTGGFLVPHINGVAYSHKPPLLFWLIHAGWSVFGVQLWWPRLLGFLFLTADALLLKALAQRLWPGNPGQTIGRTAASMLLGTFALFLFGTMLMFDLLLLLWVLLAWYALVDAHRGARRMRTIMLFAFGIGCGILAKGPVVLLFALPPALAAAHWSGGDRGSAKNVALTALGGTLLGACIALAWAIPAGIAGGQEYREAIFWGQTAGRVADSFAHARPWHWYLPLLPVMLLPWPLFANSWRGWKHQAANGSVSKPPVCAQRFLFWAGVPTFLFLCLMSGKQPHYLLPLLTLCLLALAFHHHFHLQDQGFSKGLGWLPPLFLACFVFVLLLLPQLGKAVPSLAWTTEAWTWYPGALLGCALVALVQFAKRPAWSGTCACLLVPTLFAGLHFGLHTPVQEHYNLQPFSHRVAQWQAQDEAVAFFAAHYHGQYTFFGRLETPVANPEDLAGVLHWAAVNPDGHLLVVLDKHAPMSYFQGAAELIPYGVQRIALWRAADFAAAQNP